MEIINYESKYDEDIKKLLVELQEYVVSIDKDKYNVMTESYREESFRELIISLTKSESKLLLAKDINQIVGLILGIVNNEEEDTYCFNAPKRGRVVELIVTKEIRSKGIGRLLLNKMEEYFISIGCKAVLIDVFGYNNLALSFYHKYDYFNRNVEVMKKLI